MLSNTSSGGEGGAEVSRGVRKLVKRSNKSDEAKSQSQQKPRMSRLGVKNAGDGDSQLTKRGIRRLGDSKTPESSNVSSVAGGSDSEWSDKNSSATRQKFDVNVADEWNRKSGETESWDDNGDTWDDLKDLEPVCVKKKMYKCGPVTDMEEEPKVFPRLQAPGSSTQPLKEETRRFKNPEMNYLKRDIEEKEVKKSFLDEERFQSFQQQRPMPSTPPQQQQSSWLRSSWLGNVSKSVASLTAAVSQNISAALDTEATAQPQPDDFRQLVAERLNRSDVSGDGLEESPRKGRKYLHKVGIDEDIRPVYAFQQKTHDTNRQPMDVPSSSGVAKSENKPQRQPMEPKLVDSQRKQVKNN